VAEKITPKELQSGNDEYVIIDVREADELKEGQWSSQFAVWTVNKRSKTWRP
jgi:rhodanese-related sulfurtransferase